MLSSRRAIDGRDRAKRVALQERRQAPNRQRRAAQSHDDSLKTRGDCCHENRGNSRNGARRGGAVRSGAEAATQRVLVYEPVQRKATRCRRLEAGGATRPVQDGRCVAAARGRPARLVVQEGDARRSALAYDIRSVAHELPQKVRQTKTADGAVASGGAQHSGTTQQV